MKIPLKLVRGGKEADLFAEGWIKKTTIGEPRLTEIVENYRQLMFDDQFLYSISADYSVSDLLSVFAELAGNSAPAAGESRSDVGTFGVETDFLQTETATSYATFELETERTATVRVGLELAW